MFIEINDYSFRKEGGIVLGAIFNFLAPIAVYLFVGYLFWNAIQKIINKFKPREPREDYGGREYYE